MTVRLIVFAVWGCLCYFAGTVTGVRIQHHRLTREVLVQLHGLKEWLDRWLLLLAAVLMIVTSVAASLSVIQHNDDQAAYQHLVVSLKQQQVALKQQSDCVTQYANRLHESLAPRQHANAQLQRADTRFNLALLQVLDDALVDHADVDTRIRDALALKQAAETKQHVAQALSAERRRKPYPPPPKKVCPQ